MNSEPRCADCRRTLEDDAVLALWRATPSAPVLCDACNARRYQVRPRRRGDWAVRYKYGTEEGARAIFGDDAEQCVCGLWDLAGAHFDGTYFTCDPDAPPNQPGYDYESDGNRG